MATSKSMDFKEYLSKLESTLDQYLVKKAPALPDSWKEIIVKVAPWLIAIGLVFGVLGVLALFGLGSVLMPLSLVGGGSMSVMLLVSSLFLLASLVLELLALPGLFKRQMKSWRLLYYSMLVSAVHNVLTFNLGGLIIGTLLGLYVLFQIKSYYK